VCGCARARARACMHACMHACSGAIVRGSDELAIYGLGFGLGIRFGLVWQTEIARLMPCGYYYDHHYAGLFGGGAPPLRTAEPGPRH
jgi:hypothetical protein